MNLLPVSLWAFCSFLLLSSFDIPCLLGSVATFSNETDRLALLNLKHLITEDPLHSLSSWNHTLHFCHWYGVTCSGPRHPQRVTALNLTGQKLVGPISPYIGNLTFLRIIDLADNSFLGSFPEEIGRLFHLQYLRLNNNTFTGEIPANLTHCLELEALFLYGNQLAGRIPAELGSLLKLTYLILTDNNLIGSIPPSLGNLSSLASLYLSVNSLKGSIPDELGRLASLEEFGIRGNEVSDDFSSANLVGTGSFGTVYKGVLERDGTMVAVKVFNLQRQGALRSFMAECEALRNIRHRNLVKILTCCSSIDTKGNDFKALIYKYMPNGSLDEWLHSDGQRNLKFTQRLNIALDVASALDYLHNHCQVPIIHRDLKPSNVLLDDDMTARVGDFGLARFLSEVAQASLDGINGSLGYIAPEYAMGSKASTQGDVYSYGILLLEMIIGKGPTDEMFKDNLSLHYFAKLALPERVMEIVDPRLLVEEVEVDQGKEDHINTRNRMRDSLVSMVKIGVFCSIESPRERMCMRDVNAEMYAIKDLYLGAGIHRDNKLGRKY